MSEYNLNSGEGFRAGKVLGLVFKVILLTFIMFISFAVAGIISGAEAETPEDAGATLLALLAVCFLMTVSLTYPIVRSRWSGLKLMATVFFVFYGVMSIMSLIEAVYFMTNIPDSEMPRLFLMGAVVALIFSPLAVLVLGKVRGAANSATVNTRLVMPLGEWIWKLAAIAALYLVLYFTFGYYLAWKNPVLREFYQGGPLLGLFPHLREVLTGTLLAPFQILRALLWVVLALPVIRMMKGRPWEAALAVSILFGILHTAQLLLPNPYMPADVRMIHLVETASSMLIFGWLVTWILIGTRPTWRRP